MSSEQKLPSPSPDAIPLMIEQPYRPDLRFLPNRAWDNGQQRYPQIIPQSPNDSARQSIQEVVARTIALDQGIPVPTHLEPTIEIPLQLGATPSRESTPAANETHNGESRRLAFLGKAAVKFALRHSDTDRRYFGRLIDLEPELQKWDNIHSAEKKAQTLRTSAVELETNAQQLIDNPQTGHRYRGVDAAIKKHRAESYVRRATILDGTVHLQRQGLEPRKYPSLRQIGRRIKIGRASCRERV